MENQEIFSYVDHTLLDRTATWEEIRQICEEGMKYHTASVCIPPSFVKQAKGYVGDRLPVCTVIGFPNGYHTTKVKVFETREAVSDGADEIDMVIPVGKVKEQAWAEVTDEIGQIREACHGKILKVIIETCLLTREEKVKMCRIVTDTRADYIKTSTGFSTGGATFEDVQLFAEYVGKGVGIKAAGGISSFEDAREFIRLGATRLGTSRIVRFAKEQGITGVTI